MLMNRMGLSSMLKAPERMQTMKVCTVAVFLARSVMSMTVFLLKQSGQ
jgi:hypothetical protein